jgi:hypothetical protein
VGHEPEASGRVAGHVAWYVIKVGQPDSLPLERPMVDMPLPDLQTKGRSFPPVAAFALKQARWLLALVLISSGCWIAVSEMSEQDKCQTPIARLAVKMNLDSVYSGCRCVKPMLDLSDSCNLALATAVGV